MLPGGAQPADYGDNGGKISKQSGDGSAVCGPWTGSTKYRFYFAQNYNQTMKNSIQIYSPFKSLMQHNPSRKSCSQDPAHSAPRYFPVTPSVPIGGKSRMSNNVRVCPAEKLAWICKPRKMPIIRGRRKATIVSDSESLQSPENLLTNRKMIDRQTNYSMCHDPYN